MSSKDNKAKAKESSQVKKYRKKLEESLLEEKKMMNPEAIKKMKDSIHQWIKNHADERIDLKLTDKDIELFDENRHPAAPKSKFINHLLSKLKEDKPVKPGTPRKFKAKKL